MKTIDAKGIYFQQLNQAIRKIEDEEIVIENCVGQRYLGTGIRGKQMIIHGTAGNALGAYLEDSTLHVYGNAQDATGDTMDGGTIFIHGSSGDATGYAMRGGKIFIKGNAGYRAGIHMKAYEDKVPVVVIGGKVGSFLGEYQAGGHIVVLGLGVENEAPVGRFCATGMHGGKIFLRGDVLPTDLPQQIIVKKAEKEDLKLIEKDVQLFCEVFDICIEEVMAAPFYVLTPDTANPYKQLYTHN